VPRYRDSFARFNVVNTFTQEQLSPETAQDPAIAMCERMYRQTTTTLLEAHWITPAISSTNQTRSALLLTKIFTSITFIRHEFTMTENERWVNAVSKDKLLLQAMNGDEKQVGKHV
jgi:hypothetical protein